MTRESMYDTLMEIAGMMIEDGFTAAEVTAIAAGLQKIKAERWEQERLTGRDLGTKMIGGNAWILDKVAIYMEAYFGDTSRDIWADTYEDAAIVSSKCSEIIDPIYHNDDEPAEADIVLDLMWKCSEIIEEETIPEITEADILSYADEDIRFIIGSKPDGNPDDYDIDGIRNEIACADEDGELFYVPGCWDESGRATEKLYEAIRRHRRS